ncbi:hypothetical protein RFF05_10420 [Bengtsoniella intestinalis]|uniref:MarR family transcriptional regulator n=1 Tax=Bengtsoniella intestinalis TaxID=3073143 RepID=UPI00391F63E3
MEHYIVNRPDADAMTQALTAHPLDMVGTVLRLGWLAGLTRGELLALTWDHVLFLEQIITVDNRRIPICPALLEHLIALEAAAPPQQMLVVLGDGKGRKPPAPQVVSRKIRAALDAVGQPTVRLVDLRHDYILRQMEQVDWQTACRHSGLSMLTLQTHFAPYITQTVAPSEDGRPMGAPARETATRGKSTTPPIDTLKLLQILDAQGTTPQGIALRLAWLAGMGRREMVKLKWGDFNLKKGVFLPENTPIDGELLSFLRSFPPQSGETLVIRGPVSGDAMLPDRLSRLCRGALVQGGLDQCTLQILRQAWQLRQQGEGTVLGYVTQRGYITTAQTQDLLDLDAPTAYQRLQQWVTHGKLVQQGRRYYPPSAIVHPHQQAHAVVAYLEANTMAYRKDLAEHLGLPPQQCSVLMKKLVAQGLVRQEKQRYFL